MFSVQHITKGAAVALVAGALAAPVASASSFAGYSRQNKQVAPSTRSAPVTAVAPSARLLDTPYSNRAIGSPFNHVSSPGSSAVARATGPGDGFDWGDAGIGAAGGLVLSIVAIGGGLVLVYRRPRQTGTTAVATG
jgi:hypothetical protein